MSRSELKKQRGKFYTKNGIDGKGFTLIEVLVTCAILVILAAGFLGIQYIFSQNQTAAWTSYKNVESANDIVRDFTKEIRDARQSATGSYFLEAANDNEIIFYSDFDYDNVVEKIRYTVSAGQIEKGVIEPIGSPISYPTASEKIKILSSDIVDTEIMFTYYNQDWPEDTENNPLVQVNRISLTKVVKIELTVNTGRISRQNYSISSMARIRTVQ